MDTAAWQKSLGWDESAARRSQLITGSVGLVILFIGVESVNQNSLLETAKVQNGPALGPAVREIQSFGFIIAPGFIFGFDSDTETVFDDTLDFIADVGLIGGDPSFLVALPGTPLFERMKRTGRLVEETDDATVRRKIHTNIRYLQDAAFLSGGFIDFIRKYTAADYQLRRFKNHLDLILKSDNFVVNDGVGYGSFIVPGLIMLSLLTQSISNASFGIYFPKFTGTIYELLSAPVSSFEIVLGYVGAAATKSMVLGLIILSTAGLFVPLQLAHPVWMLLFLVLTSITFSLFGFIIGMWADNFEKLQIIPLLIVTPLVFLGGSFYSIDMLPPFWQNVTLFNPVLYLVSGFRWSFYEIADVSVATSLSMIIGFLVVCMGSVWWIFKTGYQVKN